METHRGFSLMEVLVSLLLMSIIIVSLLQALWFSRQNYNQSLSLSRAINQLDEATEIWGSQRKIIRNTNAKFKLKVINSSPAKSIQITWKEYGKCHQLQRNIS